MKHIIIIILCLTPALAQAEPFTWDKLNTQLHIPLTLVIIADMQQTLQIAHEPKRYYERNPMLNGNLSEDRVYKHFIISYALTTLMVYALPEKWSHGFQVGVIGTEAGIVAKNLTIGLRIGF